jgi:type VI protein secretion system component VasA
MNLKALKRHIGEGWKTHAAQLAEQAECAPVYIDQLVSGFRKPSARLAQKLVAAEPRLTLEALRPDVYGKAA